MKIAIKGYIGSGKTTISNLIKKEFDFFIINVDDIVNELYKSDETLKEKIKLKMNLDNFDKKELSNIVFSNENKLKELEEIVHPILLDKIKVISSQHENVIIDCQVIDKLNLEIDGEIIVFANKKAIINRVEKRDSRTKNEIENIINIQEKFMILKNRTYVIDSEKNQDDLIVDIKKILKLFDNHIKNKEENLYEKNR